LENRCYYIIDKSFDLEQRLVQLELMNSEVKSCYSDFALKVIPIVTDVLTSRALQTNNAKFIKTYKQSIWLREGFELWYDHIEAFLKRIESRV